MASGPMRRRCAFKQKTRTSNGAGGFTFTWPTLTTVWGQLKPIRGTEREDNGRIEANVEAELKVRSSATLRTVNEDDQVTISGEDYNIRAITNPDQRNKYLLMQLERGNVAQ